tara:strand:+ start:442 stop:654 length:213 start_codon:yes stop_codon:yes gene_type:complete
MDWTYEQLRLTEVSKTKTPQQQKEQWQKELNDWFDGFETIRVGDNYIVEERIVQISAEEFNGLFGTNLKY